MKRKRVTLYLTHGPSHAYERVSVEAYCNRCVYYKEDGSYPGDKGACLYNPKSVKKDEHDWCAKFKPEREAEPWER